MTTGQVGCAAGAILAAAYVLVLGVLSPLTLQDFPAHLETAVTMADLVFHGGSRFGGMFTYHFLFVPYWLGDFGFAALVELLGPQAGGACWVAFVFLSLPCALLYFMHVSGVPVERRALLFLLSLYLATDWFFLMGFLSFRLGLAITLVNLALVSRLRTQWSTPLFLTYAVVVSLGYLTHLTTIAFLLPAVAVPGCLRLWRRTSAVRIEALLLAPIVALGAWHFGVAAGYTLPGDPIENPYTWGSIDQKLAGLDVELVRFRPPWDAAMALGLALCMAVSVGRVRLRNLLDSPVLEMLLLAGTFIAIYLVLPMGYSEAWYVDVRALALVTLCLILACAMLPSVTPWARKSGPALATFAAAVLVALNLVYLERHLARGLAWLGQYRAVLAALPTGARVLPVVTRSRDGYIATQRHADAFITIDRGGLMPYAFTADTANPEKYLRYVHKPYAPVERWYFDRAERSVDWRSIERDYDYVLIDKPYDARRIPLALTTVAENGSAALVAIRKDPPPPSSLLTSGPH
ncbi:MAG TPA: hypothetical protein VFS52_22995 [Steroidobacteraceae bacterium]|nr:hypothetical protein [Steroidobacteraceae bacterium]